MTPEVFNIFSNSYNFAISRYNDLKKNFEKYGGSFNEGYEEFIEKWFDNWSVNFYDDEDHKEAFSKDVADGFIVKGCSEPHNITQYKLTELGKDYIRFRKIL